MVQVVSCLADECYLLPWPNWIRRLTTNQEIGGSSPPGGAFFVFIFRNFVCEDLFVFANLGTKKMLK